MKTEFVSFDGTEKCVSDLEEPDRYRTLYAAMERSAPCAVRGSGLSYCLATAGAEVTTISSRQFNRVLAFDPDERIVTIESGMSVGDLSDFAIARECYFPVLPGHPSITVGGCAGFNVHGKTQHNVGHFSDHVVALTLFHPDHGELRCSAGENRDLLDLTLGGMGLTGFIVDLTLRLQPLAGRVVRRRVHRVANLQDAIDTMQRLTDRADALYSWNDFNVRGPRFGAGVVHEERFEPADLGSKSKYRTLTASGRRRGRASLWNARTIRVANILYRSRESVRRETVSSVHDAAFPINGNELYFQLFGSRGLREYQMILSHDAWRDAAEQIERALDRSDVPATLGSLKLFTGSPHMLWFRDDGVCLTIDAPAVPGALDLFRVLDRIAVDFGAPVNLSKDSRIRAETVRDVYRGYDGFRSALDEFDPKRRFDSMLRRRLEL
jgi:FAD/FMN-containing dehydrogenase